MSLASASAEQDSRAARATLSVAIITYNEEANLDRTLASVAWADEIVIVDSGSTDRTAEIAARYRAQFTVEAWKGFGAQKNSALAKCSSHWILSLDADEEVSHALTREIQLLLISPSAHAAWFIPRLNLFLGKALRHGGYYPDPKLRLVRNGAVHFEEREVHETMQYSGSSGSLRGELIHYAYPTLSDYIEHMNRYSSLGAEQLRSGGRKPSFLVGVVLNPLATFFYNYVVRGGWMDGREGLLAHLYHSIYVSWKYAKAWESERATPRS